VGVPRETLDRIKSRLDALEIIRDAVPTLKQSGPRWRGNCPFHNERTPSFFFMPEKGLWHCFGACQEGGDVFAFVMKARNLNFPEALRELARRAGVPLEWDRADDAASQRAKERDALFSLLDEAARFYAEALKAQVEAEPARRHLADRGVRRETVDGFQLGYAPRRESFLDIALKRGTAIEPLLKSGLAARSDRTGRYHDPLTGRLIFPIRDPYGQVVAFGGRVLQEEAGPKYLNSPESPVYTKGRQLYGLYEGRSAVRERGQAIVVEGYMDVVGLHQAGHNVAVAPLGTALTTDQAKLLRRYVQEAILLFDPDPAGQRATWRSAEIFLKEDLFVRAAQVPGGMDPDDYVRQAGAPALEKVLAEARDVVDFWLDLLAPALGNFSDLHGRLRRAEELLRFVSGVPNAVLREEWVKRVAERLRFDPAALKLELRKLTSRAAASVPPAPPEVGGEPVVPLLKRATSPRPEASTLGAPWALMRGLRSVEEEVLQILGSYPETWGGALPEEAHFFDERCRRVYRFWREEHRSRGTVVPGAAAAALPEGDAAWLSGLLVEEKNYENPGESLARGLTRLENLARRREREMLEPEVLGMLEGRAPRDDRKILRYQTLTRELRAVTPEPSGRTAERQP